MKQAPKDSDRVAQAIWRRAERYAPSIEEVRTLHADEVRALSTALARAFAPVRPPVCVLDRVRFVFAAGMQLLDAAVEGAAAAVDAVMPPLPGVAPVLVRSGRGLRGSPAATKGASVATPLPTEYRAEARGSGCVGILTVRQAGDRSDQVLFVLSLFDEQNRVIERFQVRVLQPDGSPETDEHGQPVVIHVAHGSWASGAQAFCPYTFDVEDGQGRRVRMGVRCDV